MEASAADGSDRGPFAAHRKSANRAGSWRTGGLPDTATDCRAVSGCGRMLHMKTPTILMCPPDYYGIEHEINPRMSRARARTPEPAVCQWRSLNDTLVRLA